jgi:hypothetical protein
MTSLSLTPARCCGSRSSSWCTLGEFRRASSSLLRGGGCYRDDYRSPGSWSWKDETMLPRRWCTLLGDCRATGVVPCPSRGGSISPCGLHCPRGTCRNAIHLEPYTWVGATVVLLNGQLEVLGVSDRLEMSWKCWEVIDRSRACWWDVSSRDDVEVVGRAIVLVVLGTS